MSIILHILGEEFLALENRKYESIINININLIDVTSNHYLKTLKDTFVINMSINLLDRIIPMSNYYVAKSLYTMQVNSLHEQ